MIKVIIFDWYRVLTIENWSDCLKRELNQRFGIDKQTIKDCFIKFHQPFARDEISPEQFLKNLLESLKLDENPKDFLYLFKNIPDLNQELFEILLKLKKTYKIALFSNNFKPVFTNYSFDKDKYFDEVFLSYGLTN